MKSKVAVKSCSTYELDKVEKVLTESISLLGGISAFFRSGKRVLIKPNLLTDSRPEKGITTHPNFVRAIVRIIKRAGFEVAIADIPGEHRLESNLERVYKASGMREVAQAEDVRLLTETKFVEEDGVIYSSWVKEFDHIISAPKFKTHSLTTLTGAVKNMFGLTPRLYRIRLHKRFLRQNDFAKMLINVYKKCKPTLSMVDGIVAMEGNGPAHSGTLRNVGLIAVSADGLSVDSVLANVMGLKPNDIPTNLEGGRQSLGITAMEDIEIVGDNLENFKKDDFDLPPAYLVTQLPDSALKFLNRFAEFRPRVDRHICNGCGICIENCPLSVIELEGKKARIDYTRCVDCFCCLETCPIGAMKTKSGPLIHALKFREWFRKAIAH
ncbi:MAG: hypothetical protein A2987_00755 [Omnitrophica bacterium RIFCSPLOWO2_01_FULL_45_10]|nr:MAG: hypothetical protein A2987_00755 [Omnitrophica bacterium RIFCSPLOWO2_01_FULL_45_10]